MSSPSGSRPWLDPGREAELVIAAQRGDANAFMELLRSYRRVLWRVAYALTRREDETMAVLSETARRAWSHVGQLPAGRPFLPWFVRMLLPVAHASAAAARTGPEGTSSGSAEFLRQPTLEALERHRVRREWNALHPEAQLLLTLVLMERFSYADASMFVDRLPSQVAEEIAAVRDELDRALHPREGAA